MNRKAAYAFIICAMLSVAGGIAFMAWVLKRAYHFREIAKDHPGLRMFNASLINGVDPSNAWLIIICLAVVIVVLFLLLRSVQSGVRNTTYLLLVFIAGVACFAAGLWYIKHIEHRYFKHSRYLKLFVADTALMILTGIWWSISLLGKKQDEGQELITEEN